VATDYDVPFCFQNQVNQITNSMSFSTNPSRLYQPPNLCKFIGLSDAGTTNFKPTTRYNLDPNNAMNYMADLENSLKKFCYNEHVTWIAAKRTEANNRTVTFSGHKDITKTCHEITKDVILKTADKI
jgi:hypothetical protein